MLSLKFTRNTAGEEVFELGTELIRQSAIPFTPRTAWRVRIIYKSKSILHSLQISDQTTVHNSCLL